jgi:hypothetical protein
MDKAWDYLASYTVGERPNASEVNDLIAVIEDRMNQPERQWVGLTDEEVQEIMEKTVANCSELDDFTGDTARLTWKNCEAKLKEKNGG